LYRIDLYRQITSPAKTNTNMMNTQGQKLRIILLIIGVLVATLAWSQDRTSTRSSKGSYQFHNSGLLQNFDVEYRGDIVVTDDDKDVKSISPGGYLEISKTTFGNRRDIVIRESNGQLIKEYYEGRTKVPFEPNGRQWLADVLPDVIRSTGIAAKSRVDRFYKKSGVSGVINEIGYIDSDYVGQIYAKELLELPLSNSELVTAIRGISRELGSDYYLASVLNDYGNKYMKNSETASAYVIAIREISSDYYAASVLNSALKTPDLSSAIMKELITTASDINSDYYMATVLSNAIDEQEMNSENLSLVIDATGDMSSDSYKTNVLKKALDHPNLSPESFASLMNSVGDMSSDYYISSVLSSLLKEHRGDLDKQFFNQIISTTEDMSSDHYKTLILTDLITDFDLNDSDFEALSKSITSMSSDYYISSVLTKAAEKPNLSSKSLISIIRSSEEISSDHYKTQVLLKVAPKIKKDDEQAKAAFKDAVKSIHSDYYYGQLMRNLDY